MRKAICVCGIRPDFIRMSEIFKRLDNSDKVEHILIHTGQHFQKELSNIFFEELNIRQPDVNLEIGGFGKDHVVQLSELNIKLVDWLRGNDIDKKNDLIVYLGDSNSVASSLVLKKEGYRVCHAESGMRSGDFRMAEEINRITCDHCSDILFPYHINYAHKLNLENIWNGIFVVGNTIVEVCDKIKQQYNIVRADKEHRNFILLDIHRPENSLYPERMNNILKLSSYFGFVYGVEVLMLDFPRTTKLMKENNVKLPLNVKLIPLMSYINFLRKQSESVFVISDSGTAQEECPLLDVPILCPREFTERPESMQANCSLLIQDLNNPHGQQCIEWINSYDESYHSKVWLGDGNTSQRIVEVLENV